MKSQIAAFDEAYSSLHRLGLPDALPALHAAGLSISRSTLGGSHSVAVYPPIDSLKPLEPSLVMNEVWLGNEVSLYVHIAFCETRCTFCHYAVEHYDSGQNGHPSNDGRVKRYLSALTRELVFWAAKLAVSNTAVSSVYIGGGTPLILEQNRLQDIINTIRSEYRILPGAEICLEGSPLTITAPSGEDKLRFLKEHGVTRLSFGVQSFDDTVLKFAARGHKRDVPIRAAVIASQVFENWNIDLIQGLYKGSPYETWGNLKVIADVRPAHITWYHARFANRPQGDWQKMEDKRLEFEDESETLLGRMLIWQELAALGYHQIDGNRFARECRYTDPFKKIRTTASNDLLGVGAAAYSHIGAKAATENCRGYVFRNESDIRSYENCVLGTNIPIATGRKMDDEELLAASYATGLRNGRIEDKTLLEIRKNNPCLSSHYDELVKQLIDVGVLERNPKIGLRLSELGRLFEDEALTLFFSPAVQSQLAINVSDWIQLTFPSIKDPASFHTIALSPDEIKGRSTVRTTDKAGKLLDRML
jgi:coproporphyrinogen III oxidase-like Fe-S oxidoreductase